MLPSAARVDPAHIFLGGHSAGGHLSAALALEWTALGGAGATLSLLFGLYLAARELPRPGLYALQVVVLVAVSVEAILLATLLRM